MSENRSSRTLADSFKSEDLYLFMVQLEDAYYSMLREKLNKNEEDIILLRNIYNSITEIKSILRERKFLVEL
nr:hypothetical protein [Candidatus Freyarchaeota archaeon]